MLARRLYFLLISGVSNVQLFPVSCDTHWWLCKEKHSLVRSAYADRYSIKQFMGLATLPFIPEAWRWRISVGRCTQSSMSLIGICVKCSVSSLKGFWNLGGDHWNGVGSILVKCLSSVGDSLNWSSCVDIRLRMTTGSYSCGFGDVQGLSSTGCISMLLESPPETTTKRANLWLGNCVR